MNKQHQYQLSSLSRKISGIVFWGVLFLGMVGAIWLLPVWEKSLKDSMHRDALIISERVNNLVSQTHQLPQDQTGVKLLKKSLGLMIDDCACQGVKIILNNNVVLLGETNPQQTAVELPFVVQSAQGTQIGIVRVYFENLRKRVSELRARSIMVIGFGSLLFGFLLQQILSQLLTIPLQKMVQVAVDSKKKTRLRFDEKRNDEFGYLAKFINQSLDRLERRQHELQEVLVQVGESEKSLSIEKERIQVTLDSITDAVITCDLDEKIQFLNPVAERMLGWEQNEARGLGLEKVMNLRSEDNTFSIHNYCLSCEQRYTEGCNFPENLILNRTHGHSIDVKISASAMYNTDREHIGVVIVLHDVTQARRMAKLLDHEASHDALTGLCNRRRFEEKIQDLLINMEYRQGHHVLCYLDLDQFKIVNDTCGHMAGDELLKQIAMLIKDCLNKDNVLARLGGDEFGVLIKNQHLAEALEIMHKVQSQVRKYRFAWQSKRFEIGVSIGVVAISSAADTLAGLLTAADMACYAAKDAGRNRIHVFEPDDEQLVKRSSEMQWAGKVTDAIDHEKFVIFWQKIEPLKEELHGWQHWEILLRMNGSDGALILPDQFISAAERYNLMPKLDRWVIKQVFSQFNHLFSQHKEQSKITLAINLSGVSMADEQLQQYIVDCANEYKVPLQAICFEVTETAAISHLHKAQEFMHALHKRGCRFSLDDFGSGLSSFTYLKKLPVDYIKIDGSFVINMVNDPVDKAMVEAVVHMGKVMGLQTIAEWVEDEETYALLKQIGVSYAQGFVIDKPRLVGENAKITTEQI
ncbi:MAG: EAL domain-containing protein [bacterium]